MNEELLPCPVPNSISPHGERTPIVHDGMPGRGYEGSEWVAGCEDCDLWTPQFKTRAEAIGAWNARPAPNDPRYGKIHTDGSRSGGQKPATDYAPCLTCGQYSHSLRGDQVAEAISHFKSMYPHRSDDIPTQYSFDEDTRRHAQALVAAIVERDADIARLREALLPLWAAIQKSVVHYVGGERMKRVLIAETAQGRIRAALEGQPPCPHGRTGPCSVCGDMG